MKRLMTVLSLVLLMSGNALAQYAPPPEAPPALRNEPLPPPPAGGHYVWRPGHWHWTGSNYVWVTGQYVVRPTPTARWYHGFWARGADGWVWIPAHWQ